MHRPPNIVGVGGSSARVLGYVEVSVVISDVEIGHLLIVIDKLAYPLLNGTNVLRLHHEIFQLNAFYVVRLKLGRCSVCVENRLIDSTPSVSSSVSAIINGTHVLSVVNLSDTPSDLRASTPIAAVSCLTPQQATTSLNFAAV